MPAHWRPQSRPWDLAYRNGSLRASHVPEWSFENVSWEGTYPSKADPSRWVEAWLFQAWPSPSLPAPGPLPILPRTPSLGAALASSNSRETSFLNVRTSEWSTWNDFPSLLIVHAVYFYQVTYSNVYFLFVCCLSLSNTGTLKTQCPLDRAPCLTLNKLLILFSCRSPSDVTFCLQSKESAPKLPTSSSLFVINACFLRSEVSSTETLVM